jgi:mono/diheme cytochrome c family protein
MRPKLIALVLFALPLLSSRADRSSGGGTLAVVAPSIDLAQIERGRGVYQRFCLSCHGERGDGRGVSAEWLNPRPRDFTRGIFKFRSTPSGSLPTTEDLLRTLRRGLHHTTMPSWEVIGERNLRAVAEYIKTFSPRWNTEAPATPIAIPPESPDNDAARARGKELYKNLGCFNCHGAAGPSPWPVAAELKDDWGERIAPFDFTNGAHLKNGDQPEEIYRTFMTGLNGTPMPSYADSLKPEDGWALVHYLKTLQHGEAK